MSIDSKTDKQNISTAFLFLHYMEDKNIIENAVNYVLNLTDFGNSKIVIVDNCSSDGSGEELCQKYKDDERVNVIIAPQNLGFSGGNNFGYSYIKEKYNLQFLVVLNTDVYIEQKEFLNTLFELYNKYPFYAAGPDIYAFKRDLHQNPTKYLKSEEEIIRYMMSYYNKLRKLERNSIDSYFEYFKEKYKDNMVMKLMYRIRRIIKKDNEKNLYKSMNRCDDCTLQGACLIFDHRFISLNESIFSPTTFIYHEEDILHLKFNINNWNMVYFPDLKVKHLWEESSGYKNATYQEVKEKKIRRYTRLISAVRIYYNNWLECSNKRGNDYENIY